MLRNPHNLPESAGQRSVALIKGHAPKQDIIGVIVSSPAAGGNALPDAYLSAFSSMAGPLFERNVKLAQITCMLKVACTFIEKVPQQLRRGCLVISACSRCNRRSGDCQASPHDLLPHSLSLPSLTVPALSPAPHPR